MPDASDRTAADMDLLDTVRQRHEAQAFIIEGHTWRVRDTGPRSHGAPALMLLPGALGTGDVFYRVLDGIGRTRRTVSVSFPPIGDARGLADGFVKLLGALDLPVVDLLGTSLGGYVAQCVALSYPEHVHRLILANTFYDPGLQQSRWPPAADYAQRTPSEVLDAARQQLEKGEEPTPRHAELKRLMLALVGREQDGETVKAMRLAMLTAVPLGRVPLADAMITLIDDDHDPVIAAQTREQMRLRYSGCRQVRIEGGGHFPANLRPDDYQAAILAALQS